MKPKEHGGMGENEQIHATQTKKNSKDAYNFTPKKRDRDQVARESERKKNLNCEQK